MLSLFYISIVLSSFCSCFIINNSIVSVSINSKLVSTLAFVYSSYSFSRHSLFLYYSSYNYQYTGFHIVVFCMYVFPLLVSIY